MTKHIDIKEREADILDLIVESYISESKPISSKYLCKKHNLPYSSATVRNVMESLQRQGYLSHIHTSSGRIPTKRGFRQYVEHLKEEEILCNYPVEFDFGRGSLSDIDDIVKSSLDILAQMSGYTSMVALSSPDARLFFRGTRFILEQPEFEDIARLKNLFYALEVRFEDLSEILFNYVDEKMKILIGDEIGFEEISECSLIVSGLREQNLSFALALLGPMRMDYVRAASCLHSVVNKFRGAVEELL